MGQKRDAQLEIVVTPVIKDILDRALCYLKGGYAVHFSGPCGVGKTTLALYLAKLLKKPYKIFQGNREVSNFELIGGYLGFSSKKVVDNYVHSIYKKEEETKANWLNGALLKAIKGGHTFIYDEFNRSTPEANNIFLSILGERRISLFGGGEKGEIDVHPEFSMILTSNPEEYSGVYKTQDALMDRVITINLGPLDKETKESIILKNTGATQNEAALIIKLLDNINRHSRDSKSNLSLRPGIIIGDIAKKMGIPIDFKNPHFQSICLDVLETGAAENYGSKSKRTQKFILSEMDKLSGRKK